MSVIGITNSLPEKPLCCGNGSPCPLPTDSDPLRAAPYEAVGRDSLTHLAIQGLSEVFLPPEKILRAPPDCRNSDLDVFTKKTPFIQIREEACYLHLPRRP